jgi:hypothetical protein
VQKKRTFGLQSSMKNIQYNTLPKLHAPGSQAAALHASTNRKRRMIKERRRHALVTLVTSFQHHHITADEHT